MKNFSNATREYIVGLLETAEELLETNDEDEIYNVVYKHLNIVFRDFTHRKIYTNKDEVTYDDLRQMIVLATASLCQMYTDYYIIVNFNDYMEKTNNIEKIKLKDYNEIKRRFINKNFAENMIYSSVCYLQESAYEKVLQNMILTESDHELLSKINPFYEKEEYDKEIDKNFLIKQIKEWQKDYAEDKELSFLATSSFLIDLYKIDKDKAKKIIIDIINSFENEIFINNKYINEETLIDIDGILLDDAILAKIIMDFYESNRVKKLNMNLTDKN